MASFYFGVDGPNLKIHEEFQVADTDAPRILAYLMRSSYGKVTENVQSTIPDPSWSPGEGETEADRPTMAVQEWVTRQASPAEAAANYAKAQFSGLLNATNEDEKAIAIAAAAAAAAAAVKPINPINDPDGG